MARCIEHRIYLKAHNIFHLAGGERREVLHRVARHVVQVHESVHLRLLVLQQVRERDEESSHEFMSLCRIFAQFLQVFLR